jgi:hypothetical protein
MGTYPIDGDYVAVVMNESCTGRDALPAVEKNTETEAEEWKVTSSHSAAKDLTNRRSRSRRWDFG